MKSFGTGFPLFGVAGVSAGLLLAVLWTVSGDELAPRAPAEVVPAETPSTQQAAAAGSGSAASVLASDVRIDWSKVESAGDASILSIANFDH